MPGVLHEPPGYLVPPAPFPEKILRASETRQELTVVADQFGSPTFTRDLAGVIRDLVRTDGRGILRVTNTGFCSCFEFAREVLRQEGLNSRVPITTAQARRPARRSADSVLSPASPDVHDMMLRSWQKATRAYLEELRGRGKLV